MNNRNKSSTTSYDILAYSYNCLHLILVDDEENIVPMKVFIYIIYIILIILI